MPGETVTTQAVVPWRDESQWAELQLSIQNICNGLGQHEQRIREIADQIRDCYTKIARGMEQLCCKTCFDCAEACCRTATVWYDLRDLLCIYLADGSLPDRQIRRTAGLSCSNLGANGCLLPRARRPYICTWYICPRQKAELRNFAETGTAAALLMLIEEIREARILLENRCIDAVIV